LSEALRVGEELIRREHPPASQVVAAVRAYLAEHAPDGVIDYVQIVDPEDLRDVENTEQAVLIALAVRFGEARLIDAVVEWRRECLAFEAEIQERRRERC